VTKLLCALFIKSDDLSDTAVRARVGKLCGIVGVVVNLLLSAVKLFVGLGTGLISVVADAVNNVSDAASSLITYVGFVLGNRPADKEHPFGHARYEYLAALFVSAAIVLLGVDLTGEAVEKILHPIQSNIDMTGGILLILSVGCKLWLWRFYHKMGTATASAPLLATAADNKNDVVCTLAVLAGCVVSGLFDISLDGYIGLAVAGFVLWSGCAAGKDAVDLLLGKADKTLSRNIRELIMAAPEVQDHHDLLVHDYGPGMQFASCHVMLRCRADAVTCHEILDRIEKQAREELNVSLVLHYDPYED